MDGKIKGKTLELPLLGKIEDPNQHCLLEGLRRLGSSPRHWKNAQWWLSTNLHLTLLFDL